MCIFTEIFIRMSRFKQFKKYIIEKLTSKNRLILLNDETFEEKFSFQLNLMNVFVVVMVSSILIISVTTYIIAFTPLREYIPGYASDDLKKEATELALKSERLEQSIKENQLYVESLQKLLRGELEYATYDRDSILAAISVEDFTINPPTKEEKELREFVAKEDKYNLFEKVVSNVSLVFFSPVKGIISDGFDAQKRHYAVDVVVPKDTPFKSVANGTVIFSDWTPNTGNTIIINHAEGLTSIYKHAASVTKSKGDVVRTAEVLGIVGNSGSETTGVHLHFELWKDGIPFDPTKFINFE